MCKLFYLQAESLQCCSSRSIPTYYVIVTSGIVDVMKTTALSIGKKSDFDLMDG